MLHKDLSIKTSHPRAADNPTLSPPSVKMVTELAETLRDQRKKRAEELSAHIDEMQSIYLIQMQKYPKYVLDYSNHIALIPALAALSCNQIKSRIEELLPLATSATPVARVGIFALPRHKGQSIFDAISQHPGLSIVEKDSVVELLIAKRYAQYFSDLFNNVTWKPLLEKIEHIQRLKQLYKTVLRHKVSLYGELHERISQQLFKADANYIYERIDTAITLIETSTGKTLLHQLLTAWDKSVLSTLPSSTTMLVHEPIEQRINRYVNLLKRCNNRLSSSFLTIIQEHFISAALSWPSLGLVYQRADIPTVYWDAFFTRWIFQMDQNEIMHNAVAFKEQYLVYLAQQPVQTALTINFYAWGFFLQHNVIAASHFLSDIQRRLSTQTHLALLLQWVQIVANDQHDLLLMKHYFTLLTKPAAKGLLEAEENIWKSLFAANSRYAFDIFDEFVKLNVVQSKLLEFTRQWANSLVQRQEVLAASQHIKRRLKQVVGGQTLMQNLQSILSLHVLYQVEANDGEDDKETKRVTKEILKSSRRNSLLTPREEYSITHYQIYHDLRYKALCANENLKLAEEKVENTINTSLELQGEKPFFRLRM